jgi:hypothetical protein
MKTSKIVINWFVDFDKEQKWINEMCKKGWAFRHTNGVVYRFKRCEPEEFIYQIDFDEQKSKQSVGDYVTFRSSCGDKFVHQWKQKIYWKRETAAGPFEVESNVAAQLRHTRKAFNYHLNSFIGLTIIAAVAFLVLAPLGRHLPECTFSQWLTEFSTGLTFGILLAEVIILLPTLRRLHKKIDRLIDQIF